MTFFPSARSLACSAVLIVDGIFVNAFQNGVTSADFAFAIGAMVWSRPASVILGGVNPRASPALMLAMFSS